MTEPAPTPTRPLGYTAGYRDGLMERTARLRTVENDVTSLRTAVLMLCAAVAVLAYLVMRGDTHVLP